MNYTGSIHRLYSIFYIQNAIIWRWHKSSRIILEEANDTLESERNTEQEVIAKIELMDVWDKLQMFPIDMRKVVELRVLGDLSFCEIGSMLGKSENCVEEHIENCAECREIVALCRNNALTGNQAEQKALDGFRKINEKMKYLFIANLLLTAMVSFSVRIFLYRTNDLILSFTILFAACMCVNLVTGINRRGEQRAEKADYIICILSIIINISIPLLTYYCLQKNLTTPESILFGVGAAEIGPLVDWLIFAAFLIQLLFFFYHLLRLDRRKGNTAVLSCSAVTGIFLASVYHALFRRLDTPESFWAISYQINVISIIIAVLGILISVLLGRKRRKS